METIPGAAALIIRAINILLNHVDYLFLLNE